MSDKVNNTIVPVPIQEQGKPYKQKKPIESGDPFYWLNQAKKKQKKSLFDKLFKK